MICGRLAGGAGGENNPPGGNYIGLKPTKLLTQSDLSDFVFKRGNLFQGGFECQFKMLLFPFPLQIMAEGYLLAKPEIRFVLHKN